MVIVIKCFRIVLKDGFVVFVERMLVIIDGILVECCVVDF